MGLLQFLWRKEWLYNIPSLLWWCIWEFTKDSITEATRDYFSRQAGLMSVLKFLLEHPGIMALVVFIVIVVIVSYKYHRETKKISTIQRGETKIESSDTSSIPSRREALESAKIAWGLWHTGTRVRIERLLEIPSLKRILLLEPNVANPSITNVSNRSKNPPTWVTSEIISTTNEALDNGIDVRWYFTDRESSLIIYDTTPLGDKPCSENAWMYIEYLTPKVGVDQREHVVVYNKGKQKSSFVGFFKEYEDIWKDSQKSIQAKKILGGIVDYGAVDKLIKQGEELCEKMETRDFNITILDHDVQVWLDELNRAVWKAIPNHASNILENQGGLTGDERIRYTGWPSNAATLRVAVDRPLRRLREIFSQIQDSGMKDSQN